MRRALRGLIFDFDGLLVDTETARYYAWKEVIESHGVELPLSLWRENIGSPREVFDPLEFLERNAKEPIDREAVRRRKQQVFGKMMNNQSLRPGVREYLTEARRRKMKIAICSSSPREWVLSNLSPFGVEGVFDAIVTGSDVRKIKPAPELYLKVLERLNLSAKSCVAFEDSPRGVESAKAAGIFCVAVPNPITAQSALRGADLKVRSLEEMPLEELERKFREGIRG